MEKQNLKVCQRCVMDTTDPDIIFDHNQFCNHCSQALLSLKNIVFTDENIKRIRLQELVKRIKEDGKGKRYDCVIGLSGGVDSSYLAYVVKDLGLRPLAIHIDNGWNSELAVNNIENIVRKLDIDLQTLVIDWEEFRDLQIAYLKASVIDLEVLSDNAIIAGVSKIKKNFNVKYFLAGTNIETESVMPVSWTYHNKQDSLNLLSINKRFGNGKKLQTYPYLGFFDYFRYTYFSAKQQIEILNYLDYNKEEVKIFLQKELGWRDYGGKHYESKITRFYQAYILPVKFNVDKRKAHLSSLICSGQISRNDALLELSKPLYDPVLLQEDKEFFIKKLDLTEKEFSEIMSLPVKSHLDYPAYYKWHLKLKNIKNRIIK